MNTFFYITAQAENFSASYSLFNIDCCLIMNSNLCIRHSSPMQLLLALFWAHVLYWNTKQLLFSADDIHKKLLSKIVAIGIY
jgi:hypothetical protein